MHYGLDGNCCEQVSMPPKRAASKGVRRATATLQQPNRQPADNMTAQRESSQCLPSEQRKKGYGGRQQTQRATPTEPQSRAAGGAPLGEILQHLHAMQASMQKMQLKA